MLLFLSMMSEWLKRRGRGVRAGEGEGDCY